MNLVSAEHMTNHLKGQSSPYLIQHAENPVDWYPWCQEAFEKAKREDKPVFLSVGYSTCHWCHVMAHESFENQEIAELLNRHFVSVKVDREERPDIDSVYMAVCQALTGSGGWPMSIFMTADQKPFYAGTYFPPESRHGMIGFRELLLAVAEKWKSSKAELQKSADFITEYMGKQEREKSGEENAVGGQECYNGGKKLSDCAGSQLVRQAAEMFAQSFDEQYGGFGAAPKFPAPHNLIFLTLHSRLNGDQAAFAQVQKTLLGMRRGGIFDHIGYGFSRYSTDRYFLVPHFEKMLYDNALLIMAYAAAYKVCGDAIFLDTAEKTAEYIFREMTSGEGGFYSAQDADSEGEEGRFYVWDYDEIIQIIGIERGKAFCEHFGITKQGNFEGKNIPNLLNGNAVSDEHEEERRTLYVHRKSRTKLHLDDKILTSWNALMICAMAMLYRVTGEQRYLAAAEKAQSFIEERLCDGNTLYVSCREGVRSVKGFLDDYAYYTAALLSLYEATSDSTYLERAKEICGEAREQFEDKGRGGYFLYGSRNGSLIAKPKETYDGALPSGNAVMAYCLVRLSQLTEHEEYKCAAQAQLEYLAAEAGQYPGGHCMFLKAWLIYEKPPKKITVVLGGGKQKAEVLRTLPLYADVRILDKAGEGYGLLNGRTTYYVCENYRCLPPVNKI